MILRFPGTELVPGKTVLPDCTEGFELSVTRRLLNRNIHLSKGRQTASMLAPAMRGAQRRQRQSRRHHLIITTGHSFVHTRNGEVWLRTRRGNIVLIRHLCILGSRSSNRARWIGNRDISLSRSRARRTNITSSLNQRRVRWIHGNPSTGAITCVMARTAAPAAESIEWAGLAAMTELLADGTKSRLAAVPDTTLKTMQGTSLVKVILMTRLPSKIPGKAW